MNDHTSVEVSTPHYCDFCRMDSGSDIFDQSLESRVKAEYDGATVFGSWANMCEKHFSIYGTGLGLGKGQRLVLKTL